jgi:hypothetical protein
VYYQVTIEHPEQEGLITTPDLVSPRPTLCDDDLVDCRLSPILVVLGSWEERRPWESASVEIRATAKNEQGDEVEAEARAVLRPDWTPAE